MQAMKIPTSMAETGYSMFVVTGTVAWGLYLASGMNYLVEVIPYCDCRDPATQLPGSRYTYETVIPVDAVLGWLHVPAEWRVPAVLSFHNATCLQFRCTLLLQVVVPEHTRQAAFALFVGLRAEDSPKDAEFFKIHAEALQPRTFLGWLVRPGRNWGTLA